MAKSVKKRTKGSAVRARKASTPQKVPDKGSLSKIRPGTKQSSAVEMLRSPGGASLAALTKATGWQPHSVRGFLAGVVRKRLKLELESVVVEGVRIYRITGQKGAAAVETRSAGREA